MSKMFTELNQEMEKQQKMLTKQTAKNKHSDVAVSDTDIGDRRRSVEIHHDKLQTIIAELSEISVSTNGTPVRLSAAEKQDIEDFIYSTLRKKGLQGKAVSSAKLMRYALRYMIKVQPSAFVEALAEALTKEEKLSI